MCRSSPARHALRIVAAQQLVRNAAWRTFIHPDAETRLTSFASDLAVQHALQEADYRATIAASEEQGGRAAERATLQEALANAQVAATEQRAKEQQRAESLVSRQELLRRASELRDQRFALRKQTAERLTSQFPSIRVSVLQAAELDQYRDLIADALKGAGVKQGVVAEKLAQTFLPSELAGIVAAGDYAPLVERVGFDEERARKVVDSLRSFACCRHWQCRQSGFASSCQAPDRPTRACAKRLSE